MIQKDIYSVLSEDNSIAAICGNRIFPQRLPIGSVVPAVVYVINEITPVKSLSGESGLDSATVEITCWAKDYSAAHSLADAVRAAFSGTDVLTDNAQDIEDEETHNFGVVVNMTAWSK